MTDASAKSRTVTILLAGLAGASVDGLYASLSGIVRGVPVMRVWQGVAGGWLGPVAKEGGLETAALGLATHIAVATFMAAFYLLVFSRLGLVRRYRWPAALAYGLGLYGVMYLVVLPLRWPTVFPRWDGAYSVADILAHVGVALAMAWVAWRRAD